MSDFKQLKLSCCQSALKIEGQNHGVFNPYFLGVR